jgi:secretion/DNA translocation related TadE-like protein
VTTPGRAVERGSAAIWVLACCALLMVVTGAATVRALAVLARHRAESSADLAALAAAGQIGVGDAACAFAARDARSNGARLRSCTVRLDAGGRSGSVRVAVLVTVRLPVVGACSVTASARAARLSGRGPPGR